MTNRKNMMMAAVVIAVLVILYMFLGDSENLLMTDPFLQGNRRAQKASEPSCISSGLFGDKTSYCTQRKFASENACTPFQTDGACVWGFPPDNLSFNKLSERVAEVEEYLRHGR